MQIDRVMFSHIIKMCKLQRDTRCKWRQLRAFQSYWNQIEKRQSVHNFMSNTSQEIRFLQHNYARFTNTMISCLKYNLEKKINIICMQKSWIKSNQITISYSTFNKILFDQKQNENNKQRIITFVSKSFQFSVTSRFDLCSNKNIQILNIFETNIENFTILNV